MTQIKYHIDGKPFVVEGKTIVSPKCNACSDSEHEYCVKVQGSASHSCGCTCWHKS